MPSTAATRASIVPFLACPVLILALVISPSCRGDTGNDTGSELSGTGYTEDCLDCNDDPAGDFGYWCQCDDPVSGQYANGWVC